METATIPRTDYPSAGSPPIANPVPAASWPSIFAGAFVAAGATLILIALGAGLGFSIMSPWPGHGASLTGFAVTTAIWLIVTQWISASLGGYIAGRLRTRWVGTHTHEVFFRDTAHGLVTWAVASVLVAGLFAAAAVAAMGAGAKVAGGAAAGVAGGMAGGAEHRGGAEAAPLGAGANGMSMPGNAMGTYDLDRLFRAQAPGNAGNGASPGPSGSAMGSDPRLEAAHITANAIATGSVPDDDRQYLAAMVAQRTGLSPQEAQKRVDEYIASMQNAQVKARAAADEARKSAAEASLFMALSLLVGAFIASVSAVLGGRLRDEHL